MPSIEKRGTNSWRLIVESGTDAAGKRVQERKTIKIEDETILKAKRRLQDYLQMELTKFRQEVESGQYVKPERTAFAKFVPIWKANYADQHLGEYTRRNYMYTINQHLIPAFGHREMSKIKTMHVVSFFTQLRLPEARKDGSSKPLATNTVMNIYKALKSILDAAHKWRMIATNPMEGVDRPSVEKAEKKALKAKKKTYTKTEATALITTLYEEPAHWRLYYIGVLLGGFRRGEMLGVEWPHVDFARSGIYITKQISFSEDGSTVEAELKTEESEAFVPMPTWYMEELTDFRKHWVKEKLTIGEKKWLGGDKQFLFHGGTGVPYHPNTPSMQWRRLLDKHGLPRIRLHDLRHTTAMLLREDGADMKAIQERLRHTRLSTTADIYTHESDLVSRDTADRLEQLNPRRSHRNA